jgi:hypothetical protein
VGEKSEDTGTTGNDAEIESEPTVAQRVKGCTLACYSCVGYSAISCFGLIVSLGVSATFVWGIVRWFV